MLSRIEQYMNEIVSLSLMALMILALVTAELDAQARAPSLQQAGVVTDSSFHRKGELQ
jgi:hypothetical protein